MALEISIVSFDFSHHCVFVVILWVGGEMGFSVLHNSDSVLTRFWDFGLGVFFWLDGGWGLDAIEDASSS